MDRGKWLHSEWPVLGEGIKAGITSVPCCLYEGIDLYVTVGLYKHDMGCMCLMKLEATPNLSLRAQQHDTKLHNLMYLSCIYLTYTYTYTQSHIHTPTDSYVYHYTVCMSLRAQSNTFNIPWVRGCIMTSHGGLLCCIGLSCVHGRCANDLTECIHYPINQHFSFVFLDISLTHSHTHTHTHTTNPPLPFSTSE